MGLSVHATNSHPQMSRSVGGIDPDETIEVVNRRVELLRSLASKPEHKPKIQDELQLSRSTVYKAVRELDELGLVERADDGYELTFAGRLLLEKYEEFHADVECICDYSRLLSLLPNDSDLTTDVLEGAEMVFAEPHAPNQAIYAFDEMIRTATVLKGTSSVILPHSVDIVHEGVVAGELQVELILERPVIERLAADFSTQLHDAVATGNVTIWESKEPLAYGLALAEAPTEQVGIVVYGPNGEFRGMLVNDSDAALDWAQSAWERHRRTASRLDLTPFRNGSDDESL